MTKTYTINGIEVELTTCTAICSDCPEDGRQYGIYVHDLRDTNRDGDGVLFGAELPEDDDEAETLLMNQDLDTDHETLKTVKTTENNYWYAVQMDAEDNDWGTGSYDYDEAVAMAKRMGGDAQIAVIAEGNDPICVDIITEF